MTNLVVEYTVSWIHCKHSSSINKIYHIKSNEAQKRDHSVV